MDTQTYLIAGLNALAEVHGPHLEKTAAEAYFDKITRPQVEEEIFGPQFLKVAQVQSKDPWVLAYRVAQEFPGLEKAAAAGMPLAKFYVDWADAFVKEALLGSRWAMNRALKAGAKSGGNMLGKLNPMNWGSRGAMSGALKSQAPAATSTATKAVKAGPTPELQFMQQIAKNTAKPAAKSGYTLGEKALSAGLVAAPVAVGGGMLYAGHQQGR